ncbi:MAG: hypothetical protein IJC53_04765 [Clostridia bacterium]|nr:hypothetical protein [Clostridia bacterium]
MKENCPWGTVPLVAAEGLLSVMALALPESLILCDAARSVCAAALARSAEGKTFGGAGMYALSALWQTVFWGTWRIPMICAALGEGLILAGTILSGRSTRKAVVLQTVIAWLAGLSALFLVGGTGILVHRTVRAAIHVSCAAATGLMLMRIKQPDLKK